jgi:serine/threonine-protein kinase
LPLRYAPVTKFWSSAHQPKVGDTIGPYRLEDVLGEGGMAQVFRATRTTDSLTVALKVMKSDFIDDDVYRRRFVHEARSAAEVHHEHLVPIVDAGEADGVRYLAVGYVEGRTLEQWITADGPLPRPEVLRVATEVASGLAALHEKGIVHRDIKASNILIDQNGAAMLTDFGLAKGRAYTALTKPGQVLGTLDYLAPELIKGEQATEASDVYALGCLTYECIAGKPPFAHKSVFEVGIAHLDEDPEDPGAERDDWPAELSRPVLQALAKDPALRPASATAFATMLRDAAR